MMSLFLLQYEQVDNFLGSVSQVLCIFLLILTVSAWVGPDSIDEFSQSLDSRHISVCVKLIARLPYYLQLDIQTI